jgi:hypothetical protein
MVAVPLDSLRVRWRHLAILIVFLVIAVAVRVPATGLMDRLGLISPGLLLLVAAPWLLGLLVLLMERKSPFKFWAAPLLLSLSAPAFVLWLNSVIMLGWPHMPSAPTLLGTLWINIMLIGWFTVFLRRMRPRCCPECRTRSMIPLRRLLGADPRTPNTFWCASCGTSYWRTMIGEWKKERRQTWLDVMNATVSPAAARNCVRFDSESRSIAPVVRSCGRFQVQSLGSPLASDSAEMATVAQESGGLRDGSIWLSSGAGEDRLNLPDRSSR